MRVWPNEQETLVLPLTAHEATRRLRQVTQPSVAQEGPLRTGQSVFLFNGQVNEYAFRLSQKITRPNNFLPFIIGNVEPTSQGCLLFVQYRLFTMTLAFLVFWLIVTFGFGVYLAWYERLYHYAALSVGVGLANYAVALLNFRKQVGISRRLLRQVLS